MLWRTFLCHFFVKKISFSKNTILALLLVITILLSCIIDATIKFKVINAIPTSSSGSSISKIVVLDAGHGGEDCGAIGINGVFEKNLNFDITSIIGENLISRGYNVIYTRTTDALLYTESENIKGIRKISDLKNRVKIAEMNPNAVFISIHMNSFGDSKYSGLQVYYGIRNDESYSLAKHVQDSVRTMIQPNNNRKVKRGDKLFLLENISGVSILIECGFLSNAQECEKLSQKEYQKSLSFAIVCGIIEYMNEFSN